MYNIVYIYKKLMYNNLKFALLVQGNTLITICFIIG